MDKKGNKKEKESSKKEDMNNKDNYFTEHKIHRIICDGKVGPKFLDYLKERFKVSEFKDETGLLIEEKDENNN